MKFDISNMLSSESDAGSVKVVCKFSSEDKSLECDYNGLKLTFDNPKNIAECKDTRSFRIAMSTLQKMASPDTKDVVMDMYQYMNKPDKKYKKVFFYDTILEVAVPPLTTGLTKKFAFHAEAIKGQGPCEKHLGMDILVKNMDSNDSLTKNLINTSDFKPQYIYGKETEADTYKAKINGLMGFFWMFVDTAKDEYIKEIDFTVTSCGSRTDGKRPNVQFKGLIRVYRDDRFVLSFNVKSSLKYSKGREKKIGGSFEEYTTKAGTKQSVTYQDGKISGLKEEVHGFTRNKIYSLDEKGNEVVEKGTPKLNEKIFTLTRNGNEVDASKIINRAFEIKDAVMNGIDFVKEIKDAIPEVGITGDISMDLLFGTITADWGLAKSADSTSEYVWIEPDFNGSVKITLVELSGTIKAGITTASPGFLDWWGEKAWEFEISIKVGIKGAVSISGNVQVISGDVSPGSSLKEVSVISGCEYKGNDGKEKEVLTNTGKIEPIAEGVAKINVYGVGAQARISLQGNVTITAVIIWPFNIKYGAKLAEGNVVMTYEADDRKPSQADPINVWQKNDSLIRENYAFGGRK